MSEPGAIDDAPQERDWDSEARALHWYPKEEYRGDPDQWVDAKTFVLRGEQQLPILQANNKRLMRDLADRDKRLSDLSGKFDALQGSVEALRQMAVTSNEAGYQRAISELKTKQRQAVEQGDTATFDRIQGEIDDAAKAHDKVSEAAKPVAPKSDQKGVQGTPEFKTWFEDNQGWVQGDPTLGRAAVQIETELRNSDEVFTEAELWDRVTEMVQEKYPRRFAAATGKPVPSREEIPSSSSPTRAAASVLTPRGGGAPLRQAKTGIDAIGDVEERKAARAAYNRIKAGIPDYSEKEYMEVYGNPGADTISYAQQRKAKANVH